MRRCRTERNRTQERRVRGERDEREWMCLLVDHDLGQGQVGGLVWSLRWVEEERRRREGGGEKEEKKKKKKEEEEKKKEEEKEEKESAKKIKIKIRRWVFWSFFMAGIRVVSHSTNHIMSYHILSILKRPIDNHILCTVLSSSIPSHFLCLIILSRVHCREQRARHPRHSIQRLPHHSPGRC